jgi:phage gpG-like protein
VAGNGVQVLGIPELQAAFKKMTAQLDLATRTATVAAVKITKAEIRQTLATTSHQKGTPTPSSPGEPPSKVTGFLRDSIDIEGPHRLGFGLYVAELGPTAPYGRIQELGGVAGRGHATTLPARPFVAPSYDRLMASGALAAAYYAAWKRVAFR